MDLNSKNQERLYMGPMPWIRKTSARHREGDVTANRIAVILTLLFVGYYYDMINTSCYKRALFPGLLTRIVDLTSP